MLARYRECHLLILKTLQDQRAYGPQWTNKNVTQCLINHSDDYKYNIDLVEKLIRSNFINMQLYDQHLAQVLSLLRYMFFHEVAYTEQRYAHTSWFTYWFKTSLSAWEVVGPIPKPVRSYAMLPTARRRCRHVSALPRR